MLNLYTGEFLDYVDIEKTSVGEHQSWYTIVAFKTTQNITVNFLESPYDQATKDTLTDVIGDSLRLASNQIFFEPELQTVKWVEAGTYNSVIHTTMLEPYCSSPLVKELSYTPVPILAPIEHSYVIDHAITTINYSPFINNRHRNELDDRLNSTSNFIYTMTDGLPCVSIIANYVLIVPDDVIENLLLLDVIRDCKSHVPSSTVFNLSNVKEYDNIVTDIYNSYIIGAFANFDEPTEDEILKSLSVLKAIYIDENNNGNRP